MGSIQRDASLAALNTLRVSAHAAVLCTVTDTAGLQEALAMPETADGTLTLGEGSNLLLTRDFPGVVIRPLFHGIDDDGEGLVTVGAGENWHAFVRWSLDAGYCGLENLALIPGSVGAAPVQNIGAYGTELDEFVESVQTLDLQSGERVTLSRDQCGFGYRDSIFRRAPETHIVVAVQFRLPRQRPLRLDYAGVHEELAAMGIDHPTAPVVAAAVERIRRRKLPDPAKIGNAGSFFKNPVVTPSRLAELRAEWPALPVWPAAEGAKLSAAWLLEDCGMKGLREGDAGFAGNHALVLVNYGTATGAQLMALALRAQEAVAQRFSVTLEIEPRVI